MRLAIRFITGGLVGYLAGQLVVLGILPIWAGLLTALVCGAALSHLVLKS